MVVAIYMSAIEEMIVFIVIMITKSITSITVQPVITGIIVIAIKA